MPTPPNPSVAPDFAHHDGVELFHYLGAKWHHAHAVLVVYGEQPASVMLQDCAVILTIDCSTNWHGIVKHKCILAEKHDMHDFQSILLHHAIFFLSTLGNAFQHSVVLADGQMNIHDLSAVKMLSWSALPSFLKSCRWVVARRTCITLWSSLSACWIQCAQTFHFSKLLVRIH
jgi:hypothetical protein